MPLAGRGMLLTSMDTDPATGEGKVAYSET